MHLTTRSLTHGSLPGHAVDQTCIHSGHRPINATCQRMHFNADSHEFILWRSKMVKFGFRSMHQLNSQSIAMMRAVKGRQAQAWTAL